MKYYIHIFVCLSWFSPGLLHSQEMTVSNLWRDPEFVERFTSTFLPITEFEPKISEDDAELFQELATLLGENQMEQAIIRLEAAIAPKAGRDQENQVNAALHYALANLYLQAGRLEDAAAQYRIAIDKFENFRRAYKNLGLAQIQSGQYDEAIKSLVKAIELGDNGGDTFGLLAYGYLNSGNSVAALEGYRQASLLNPSNREWQIGKAEALMRTQRYREAIADFKQLITELPNRSAFYTSISNAYLSLNEPDSAAVYLEILRRKGEAQASALGLLGDIYLNDGLSKLALDAYLEALEGSGFTTNRSLRVLNAFLQRGHYNQAQSLLSRLENLRGNEFSNSETREILNLKAQLALAKGQDQEAAILLEQVLEEDPLNGNALMLLGDYHQNLGDLESALYYYERALKVVDRERDAQLQMARIHVQQREYLNAIRQLEAALDLEYSANVQDFLDAVRSVYNRSL